MVEPSVGRKMPYAYTLLMSLVTIVNVQEDLIFQTGRALMFAIIMTLIRKRPGTVCAKKNGRNVIPI
jgi:hypothetical protein